MYLLRKRVYMPVSQDIWWSVIVLLFVCILVTLVVLLSVLMSTLSGFYCLIFYLIMSLFDHLCASDFALCLDPSAFTFLVCGISLPGMKSSLYG